LPHIKGPSVSPVPTVPEVTVSEPPVPVEFPVSVELPVDVELPGVPVVDAEVSEVSSPLELALAEPVPLVAGPVVTVAPPPVVPALVVEFPLAVPVASPLEAVPLSQQAAVHVKVMSVVERPRARKISRRNSASGLE
jgi:hypothetical protein